PTCHHDATQSRSPLRLLALLLELLRAHRTVPRPVRLALKANARPMKPLIGAIVVVAGHHIPIAHVMAKAVGLLVPAFLILVFGVSYSLVAVGVFAVGRRRARRTAIG